MITIQCETGEHVHVEHDSLDGANLRGLNLHRALLEGKSLQRADLSNANLRSARLERADFSHANLKGVSFAACTASDARFRFANLGCAMMRSGFFERADFQGANLAEAKMERAHLSGQICAVQICGAKVLILLTLMAHYMINIPSGPASWVWRNYLVSLKNEWFSRHVWVPDVSFTANPNEGGFVFLNGQAQQFGGNSLVLSPNGSVADETGWAAGGGREARFLIVQCGRGVPAFPRGRSEADGKRTAVQQLLHVKTAIINGRLDRHTGHHSVPAEIAA
jgi:hypothetical protein